VCRLPDGEKNVEDNVFICFDRMYERDRHTDKRTDRQIPHEARLRLSIASRGKNHPISMKFGTQNLEHYDSHVTKC